MRPLFVKNVRLLVFIIHLALASAQASDTTNATEVRPNNPTSHKLVIAAAAVAPGLALSIIFVMTMLCRRPFGESFALRTPGLFLGVSPPFENASSLIKHRPAHPDTGGEANV